ncbi:MAG: hypothetical protein IKE16_09895 [Solobacterium sp.]|nr:hypothetical protein [Solobacterium sp.]
MRLDLFDFIDRCMEEYDLRKASFEYAEKVIYEHFKGLVKEDNADIVAVFSRVKSRESLREKLLRNKFYLNYETPHQALGALSDLIGVTLECRFIRSESELYKKIRTYFTDINEEGYALSLSNDDIVLNLGTPQPQMQRNGFAIYRVDGRYRFSNGYIGFELQIKSLVHRFWSEIEHEVVYKNQEIIRNDRFMTRMLGTIRDSLDVVDHQLETVYNEMLLESREAQIGFDERSFKTMATSSLNELFIRKMNESVGFSTSFKHDSEILSQYIYITEFIYGGNPEVKMVEFLEGLSILSHSKIDFSSKLVATSEIVTDEPFVKTLGQYFLDVMNVDFEWHTFFTVLCALQTGNVSEDIEKFATVIRSLIIQPKWYSERFSSWSEEEAAEARAFLAKSLAQGMISSNTIHMIHEDYILKLINYFWNIVDTAENSCLDYESFCARKEELSSRMEHEIHFLLH